MKKRLAFLLSIVMVMSINPSFAKEAKDFSYCIDFAKGIDVIDNQAASDEVVKRGELAQYLCNIICPDLPTDEKQKFIDDALGTDNYDKQLTASTTTSSVYDDVSRGDASYSSIIKIKAFRIMNGVGDNKFAPNDAVTYYQAAVAFLKLTGNDVFVKNNDYLSQAMRVGLFNGLSYSANKEVTVGELARILYNCWDIDMVFVDYNEEATKYSQTPALNVFEHYMSIYKTNGVLEKTPYVSIYGDEVAAKNSVVISSVSYMVNNYTQLYDLIGRDLEFFYKKDDYEGNTVLWAYLSNKDKAITVAAKDFLSLNNYLLKYEENSRTKQISIAKSSVLIYNNTYKSQFTADDFVIENGTITAIKPSKDNTYSILIVNSYKSMRVTSIVNSDSIVYSRCLYEDVAEKLVLDDAHFDADNIIIEYANGTAATFADIAVNNILDVCEGDNYIKIIISTQKLSKIRITSVYTEDGTICECSDGSKVEILESYYDSMRSNGVDIDFSSTYNALLNSFGQIVYLEFVASNSNKQYAYIIKIITDDDYNDYGSIKYLGSDGIIRISPIHYSTIVVTQDRQTLKIKANTDAKKIVDSEGSLYTGVAKLEVDEDDFIIKIDLPVSDGQLRDNTFGTMVQDQSRMWCITGNEKFFENVMVKSDTVMFNVTDDQSGSDECYKVRSITDFADAQSYNISAFNRNSDSAIAECVLVKGDLEPYAESSSTKMYIIDQIFTCVNDDEPVKAAKAYEISVNAAVKAVTLVSKDNSLEKAETFFDADANIRLQKGDIIYAEFDRNRVVRAVLVYRIYPSPNENSLYGTSGVYDPENGDATNPYKLSNLGALYNYNVTAIRQGGLRFFSGKAYNLEEVKYLTYTSQPIDCESYDLTQSDSRYLTETVVLPSRYVYVDASTKNLEVNDATTADIVTYKQAGINCQDVFIYTNSAMVKQLVFIKK